jgi:hypothetical protein
MKETLDLHASQRKVYYDTIESCELQIAELDKQRVKAEKLVTKEEKKWQHVSHGKVQARQKKKAEQEERRRERREKKPETQPVVFRVRITIEVPPPAHIDSGKAKEEPPAEEGEPTASAERPAEFVQDATLTLSYTTSSASWTPHYDLRLDTANPARSTITYRAHFINRTYETWSNAQITLSTSQASFGGLNEKVPRMESWRVNLAKAWNSDVQRRGMNGLFSLTEQKIKGEEQKTIYEIATQQYTAYNQMQRPSPYAAYGSTQTPKLLKANVPNLSEGNKWYHHRHRSPVGPVIASLPHPPPLPVMVPAGQGPPIAIPFHSAIPPPPPPFQFWGPSGVPVERDHRRARSRDRSRSSSSSSDRNRFRRARRRGGHGASRTNEDEHSPAPVIVVPHTLVSVQDGEEKYERGDGEVDNDGLTLTAGGNLIAHAAAGADTYGFTTTYELPTPRTIPSTELVRRHVIAEIPLPNLTFTHVIIPKFKAAAFLKARVNNSSNIPLLPGVAGLTLDGSFLGNLSFPRCSPDETVVLELGVDQSVKVEYERPVVKRGTQGMIIMGKEEVGAFKRTMRITNTKGVSVSLVVLDQVPVPEDEKLKVIIISPKGLKDVDNVVRSGVGVDGKAPTVKPSSKLEAVSGVPQASPLKSSTWGLSKRDSLSIPPPASPLPTAHVTANAAPGTANSWGTAKATLRKNGEVRFDVDLLKGGCVSIDLEWECRMPNRQGIYALS